MLDKALAEEIQRVTKGNGMRDIHQLATDWLAMRGIVEALVIRPPFGVHGYGTSREVWQCECCNVFAESRALLRDSELHEVDCAYALARALIGPAGGESNPIEFEGVGEEE